jgi:hypothetical protein
LTTASNFMIRLVTKDEKLLKAFRYDKRLLFLDWSSDPRRSYFLVPSPKARRYGRKMYGAKIRKQNYLASFKNPLTYL